VRRLYRLTSFSLRSIDISAKLVLNCKITLTFLTETPKLALKCKNPNPPCFSVPLVSPW